MVEIEYTLGVLSSGVCLVRPILLLIDSGGGVCVCVCVRIYLFQPSSIYTIGDSTYCECALHSACVTYFPAFSCLVFFVKFCQVAQQQSKLV